MTEQEKKPSEMKQERKDRPLPEERYDSKLFKQAYKAAKEAKELEKKRKKRKSLLRLLLFLVSPALLIPLVLLILSLSSKRTQYIEAQKTTQRFRGEVIEQSNLNAPVLEDIKISSEVSAKSIFVFDPDSGSILYDKDSREERHIASLTKILSAIVVVENYKMDDVITVTLDNIPEDLDWRLKLKEGDRISIENILKAMLISSYNDAAYIVANAYPYGGYDSFIKAMNSKAKKLRMTNSNFSNPAGLDDEANYSTARDIATLVSVAKRYSQITDIVQLGEDTIYWNSNGKLLSKKIYTTNQLYGMNQYLKGFKTGVTKLAKECFVGYFIYSNGKELVTVVLGSDDRFVETELLESYFRNRILR